MPSDVTIAANAILRGLKGIVAQYAAQFPDIGGWEEKVATALPPIAGQLAKAAVDALNAAHGNVVNTGEPPMSGPTVTPPTASSSTVGNLLQEVLGFLQVGCGIIAEQSAIETLIAALPYGTIAVTIANTVCEAVMASKSGGRKLSKTGPTIVTVMKIRIPVVEAPFVK